MARAAHSDPENVGRMIFLLLHLLLCIEGPVSCRLVSRVRSRCIDTADCRSRPRILPSELDSAGWRCIESFCRSVTRRSYTELESGGSDGDLGLLRRGLDARRARFKGPLRIFGKPSESSLLYRQSSLS
ncbi:hypothetical protein BDP55DRAFT_321308 [Colletotrichum godetiae]|uniref:Secreted protein n=1 Tax=Colletotrichum godetiae TaxID=1209918 RepID=A0AAJ0AC19_9PEZI|nr:uncharacterized protein BDP55DRAFT_321308 [Colletotrichum godetiae]KAK1671022.1 hypothetical protein BDP55DRAFT_321308 [Colletotrichum godetiae]